MTDAGDSLFAPPEGPDAPQTTRSYLRLARSRHGIRVAGQALALLMIAGVLYQNQVPAWLWVAPVLHCLLGPWIGWWLVKRNPAAGLTERRTLLVAHFLGGLWVPLMSFNLLASVLAEFILIMQMLASGGLRLVAQGLAVHAVGLLAGVALFGFQVHLASDVPTILATLPFLLYQPVVVSFIARKMVLKLQARRREFEYLSQHDGLSGLYNRAHWEGLVRAEFVRFRRSEQPAVLVLADLDHFKRINDILGHAAGDQAIRAFSAVLRRELRETDVCGRYGGEEFGILLPMTSSAAAREVLERVRRSLHDKPLLASTVVTASFGVAELAPGVDDVEAWLRLADQMLYRAKDLGRDRVVVIGEEWETAPAPLDAQPAVPVYRSMAALGEQVRRTQLLQGLEQAAIPVALYDPRDRLSVANPAYLKLMQVQPNASSFAEIIRHCALVKAGPRIDNPDLEAWLRLADTLRRVQAQRSFVMHTVDGQHFQVYETSFSDGWLLNIMHPLVVDAAPEAT